MAEAIAVSIFYANSNCSANRFSNRKIYNFYSKFNINGKKRYYYLVLVKKKYLISNTNQGIIEKET